MGAVMPRIIAALVGAAVLASSNCSPAASETGLYWLGNLTIGEGFGVQVKEWETSTADLDAIKTTGFGMLRYGIGWPYVENAGGEYDWDKYDRFIADVRSHKLRSIVILTGSHPSYEHQVVAGGGKAYSEVAAPASD